MGRIIVVTSGKGGTGKSSVTAALGTALAKRGKKVLLIDCDWGLRCLDLILGVSKNTVYDLGDILSNNCEIAKAIYKVPGVERLSMIPAPNFSAIAPLGNSFKRLCMALSGSFDYILLDSPAGIESGFQVAVGAAQLALVVVTPDTVCIRDAERVGKILGGYDLSECKMVINKFSRTSLKYEETRNLDKIIDGASMQLIAVIPDDKNVPAFAAQGIPLYSKGKAAAAFRRLAARLEGEEVLVPKRL